ncbi:cation diffusion facilitator family transporter [Pseudomonas sp. NA-150]|uniref:cation diffusion facilitator family transporter n=1 Tax=Pseudomonas sp. NA-150 TaxID=3367525 RepID=UPI0037C8EA45
MKSEQAVLRISIVMTVLVAISGVVFGLFAGSSSIVFDGIYSLVDAGMSGLALAVATLIRQYTGDTAASHRLIERFNMGFWHLEPIVLALNGTLLSCVSLYALINAVGSMLGGGRALEFGYAALFAGITLLVCFTMAACQLRANRTIRSDFVALDAKTWIMAGSISLALLVAFFVGVMVTETSYAWLAPYVDPAALAIICLVIIPMPLRTIQRAFSDILLVTPPGLKLRVGEVAEAVVNEYGFLSYEAYVAKIGRAQQIELYFIVPSGEPARTLEAWDEIRDKIGDTLGDEGPHRWLTIAFTTDPHWAK